MEFCEVLQAPECRAPEKGVIHGVFMPVSMDRGDVSTGPMEALGGEAVRLWLPVLGTEDAGRAL